MHVINQTPFKASAIPMICHEDNQYIVVIVKGTFDIGHPDLSVSLDARQVAINLGDVHWGDPAKFSLKYEADTAIRKPGTDVALVAKARSTRGAVKCLDVSLKAGPLKKVVRVFGDRYWEKSTTGWQVTPPEPFESMPLVYEFAYGGTEPVMEEGSAPLFDLRNPVGKGFFSKKPPASVQRIPLPNLELPDQLISKISQKPEPAGFGFVARHWQPRSLLLGTYDEKWEKQRNPLLPTDFDPASYSAASAGLCSKTFFKGGEQVIVDNASINGQLNFTLPLVKVKVVSYINRQREEHYTDMDTVVIEPELRRVVISWRVAIPCHWNLAMVEWIKVLEEV